MMDGFFTRHNHNNFNDDKVKLESITLEPPNCMHDCTVLLVIEVILNDKSFIVIVHRC